MLYEIVFLTNSCEGSNWTTEDLENLPLVEQIPLLHRLDHSIHNVRLWAMGRAKHLTNCWNMEQFFRVTHVDINASLYALSQLKVGYHWKIKSYINHNLAMRLQLSQNIRMVEENENSHFMVCSKMRSKLISEVQTNMEKLQVLTVNENRARIRINWIDFSNLNNNHERRMYQIKVW